MIGMILVTHGRLAEEFVHAMEHVVGEQDAVATICIGPNDDMEARRREIADAIKRVDTGDGAVILTDLFGGTPSNLAISLLKAGQDRSHRRDQPADADPPRRRAQGHGPDSRGHRRARSRAQLHHRRFGIPRSGRVKPMAESSAKHVEIVNKRGLHARASAKFVGVVSAMEGCTVTVAKDGNSALGSSILGLMMLGAAKGDTIEIAVEGAMPQARLAELVRMVASRLRRGLMLRP